MAPAERFDCFVLTLNVGSLPVLCSDGLIEARNDSGFLDETRVRDIVAANADGGPAAVVDVLVKTVKAHCNGRIGDDITLLALRYTGPESVAAEPVPEGT